MKFMYDILKAISHVLPDKMYLRLKYLWIMKKPLHLNNPKTFNEKLQWLKLYDRDPKYRDIVDKYEAKKYITNILGPEYIIPTYGIWNSFDDIPFSDLPTKFVLKCTHDSGGIVVVRDKATFDFEAAKEKINKSLARDFYWVGREWPYKGLPRRIIAEKYMENPSDGPELIDYKFYCFNGVPRYLYVSQGLENHATASMSFLTTDWKFAPFGRNDYKPLKELPTRPTNYEEMFSIASTLSKGYMFIRVDLYSVGGKTYFSELTLSPCSGYMPFAPEDWDLRLGDELVIKKPSVFSRRLFL